MGFFQALQSSYWRPRGIRRDKITIPGKVTEELQDALFIYRAIDSGMVTLTEVKNGDVTIAELVRIAQYLDMKSDIEYANTPKTKARKGARH